MTDPLKAQIDEQTTEEPTAHSRKITDGGWIFLLLMLPGIGVYLWILLTHTHQSMLGPAFFCGIFVGMFWMWAMRSGEKK